MTKSMKIRGRFTTDPEARAVRDERVRKSTSGWVLYCAFENKRMYETEDDAKWTASQLAALGHLLYAYACSHPNADHYHLTSSGFTATAQRQAAERRRARGVSDS